MTAERSFSDLPGDVLSKILKNAAENSVYDFLHLGQTCKGFCETARNEYIFATASLHNYSCMPRRIEMEKFLKRACIAGNPQALYREGMAKCFCVVNRDVDRGIQLLWEASERGVIEATYALGLQLICMEPRIWDGYRVLSTLDTICSKEGFDILMRCRHVTNRMIADIWITSRLEPPKRYSCSCVDNPSWCSYCMWNYEARSLAGVLERRNHVPLRM
ncbi:hypothetical protein F3Y22_tig00110195pilonHSYRG00055 [Hibiscus syriacus]|uniref:At2g35280-like TPR domain-containing protein n=1 Tax=Hibiscus syriacus TaxID=106335 RepID=A0A6A3BI85_HIBSY|nr:putative F-box protein At1g67623 [Hibiscus syriacus]KAE8714469.1 hypothetical protein F3Y22_tig00110195pilonHSYRG00055 [Hibiscus syriacus]